MVVSLRVPLKELIVRLSLTRAELLAREVLAGAPAGTTHPSLFASLSLYLTLLSLAHSIAHCVHANVYTATSRSPKHIGTHTSRLHLLTALPQHIRPHHLHQDTGVWWEAELDIVRDALSAQLRFVREQPCRAYLLHCCIRKQTCVHREQLGRGRVP
jgi:hypothetical protein